MLTKDKIIGIFCFIDDLLKTGNHNEDVRRQVSDSEVITTAVVSSLYFGGHQDKARQFMKMTGLIPGMLDKSRFNRRLHSVAELIYSLFMQIGYYFKYISCEMSYVLDSFPVAVCDNIRIMNAKILKGRQWHGKRPLALRRVLPFAKPADVRSPVGLSTCAKPAGDVTEARRDFVTSDEYAQIFLWCKGSTADNQRWDPR